MLLLAETLRYVLDEVRALPDTIESVTPVEFNETHRYLPESVTALAGFIDYGVTPYWREVLNCFDINSPVREINVMKGVQIGWTTLLESAILYYAAHVKTRPMMLLSADKELADARVNNNIIPMLQQSGMSDIIESSDKGNRRKTGHTQNAIQFRGGAVLYPFGALNTAKLRTFSIAVMLKDELDEWKITINRQGDPDALSDDRCKGYWPSRKIGRGSTPLVRGISKIEKQFKRGDQRIYRVCCRECNHPQPLRWEWIDKETGEITGGIRWDYNVDGSLAADSVRYVCPACRREHFEYDKDYLLAEENGAHWHPTATPEQPDIRSYHLPGLYSPSQMAPWSSAVSAWLEAWDVQAGRAKDLGKLQRFYNNVLARTFELGGTQLRLKDISGHKRAAYRRGEIPNKYAVEHSGSRILFLACAVDVHDAFLAVAVFGFCRKMRCYLIDYERLEPRPGEVITSCIHPDCSVWARLGEIIDHREYTADDGTVYPRAGTTFIDAGYQAALVSTFASQWESGVYPVVGRADSGKNQAVTEFAEYETKAGTRGWRITVNRYKERLAPVLRGAWQEGAGEQPEYHFNAPVDALNSELEELTSEKRARLLDPKTGEPYIVWKRSGPNELWDLLVYASAACEIMAYDVCRVYFEMDTVDWPRYWDWVEGGETPWFILPDDAEAAETAE